MKSVLIQVVVRLSWLICLLGILWWARLNVPLPPTRWGLWCATTLTQVWVVAAAVGLLVCVLSASQWRVRLWATAVSAVLWAGLALALCRMPAFTDNPPPPPGVGTPWLVVVTAVGVLTAVLSRR